MRLLVTPIWGFGWYARADLRDPIPPAFEIETVSATMAGGTVEQAVGVVVGEHGAEGSHAVLSLRTRGAEPHYNVELYRDLPPPDGEIALRDPEMTGFASLQIVDSCD